MAKTKKGLSLVLAVVMLFSMLAVGTFAADAENAAFTVSTDAAGALKAGDTVTVTVSLTTDYFVGPLAVPVTYDATAFDLVAGSLTVSKIFGDATTDAVTSTQDGSVYVVISPKTSGTPTTAVANNLTLFTFRLTAADVNGEFPIAITDNQKTAANPGGKWYCGSFDSADPKTANLKAIGQTFTKTDATVTIGTAAKPEIVAKAETTGAVDATRSYLYGIESGTADITAFFGATNNGSLRLKAGNDVIGTGAEVELLSNAGDVVATYTVIVFGDVNGDGAVTAADYAVIKGASLGGTISGDAQTFAADVNGDGSVTAADYAVVKGASLGGTVTVNPYAAA